MTLYFVAVTQDNQNNLTGKINRNINDRTYKSTTRFA